MIRGLDYTFVVSKSIPLLTKMIELNAGVKELRDVEAILKTLELQQRVLQAVWDPSETKAQFLQLPHFEDKFIQAFQAKRKTKDQIDTIAKLQALPEEERRSLLKTLTQPQYESMMEAARQIPRVTITKAQFLGTLSLFSFLSSSLLMVVLLPVVMNEDEIYAGDVLTLVIKFFVSYKEGPIPKVDLRPAKSKSKDKGDESDGEEVEKRRQKTDRKYVLPAFTPQYPEARDSSWWVILGQKEKLTFATPLKELTTLNVVSDFLCSLWYYFRFPHPDLWAPIFSFLNRLKKESPFVRQSSSNGKRLDCLPSRLTLSLTVMLDLKP